MATKLKSPVRPYVCFYEGDEPFVYRVLLRERDEAPAPGQDKDDQRKFFVARTAETATRHAIKYLMRVGLNDILEQQPVFVLPLSAWRSVDYNLDVRVAL